jgi:hypothetical protein
MLLPVHKIQIALGSIAATCTASGAGLAALVTQPTYQPYAHYLMAAIAFCGVVGVVTGAAATSLGVVSPSATTPAPATPTPSAPAVSPAEDQKKP